MTIWVTIADTGNANALIALEYRSWVPGKDPWRFSGGSGIAGVEPTDWDYEQDAAKATLFAKFNQKEQELMTFELFLGIGTQPKIGAESDGTYRGPTFGN